jgi:hypothetical protein
MVVNLQLCTRGWAQRLRLVSLAPRPCGKAGCAAAQLVSTGAIACAEAGSHQRPNRHAELGRDMFRALERLLADPAASRGQRLLARRIHPRRAPPMDSCSAAARLTGWSP